MKVRIIAGILLFSQISTGEQPSLTAAAARFVAGVAWRAESVVTADFSCRGKSEKAILGVSKSDIVIAVFLNGLNRRPEILRYSAKVRNAATAVLAAEDLNIDAPKDLGYDVAGYRQSKNCKGLNFSDGETDSAHIYWNHKARRFDEWQL